MIPIQPNWAWEDLPNQVCKTLKNKQGSIRLQNINTDITMSSVVSVVATMRSTVVIEEKAWVLGESMSHDRFSTSSPVFLPQFSVWN